MDRREFEEFSGDFQVSHEYFRGSQEVFRGLPEGFWESQAPSRFSGGLRMLQGCFRS